MGAAPRFFLICQEGADGGRLILALPQAAEACQYQIPRSQPLTGGESHFWSSWHVKEIVGAAPPNKDIKFSATF